MKNIQTKSVSVVQIRQYLGKAQEFLDAAKSELGRRNIASTSLSIHAGIAAADVVSAVRLRKRSKGSDHQQALALLESAGKEGKELAPSLKRLMSLKTGAEYEPGDVSAKDASDAFKRASRIVQVAQNLVEELDLTNS